MDHFVNAIRLAVTEKNWYCALSSALIAPDICGKLEHPSKTSKERYVAFWDKYLKPFYTAKIAGSDHVFLSGNDAYALRCAFLHEGSHDISEQKAKEVLSNFVFCEPPANAGRIHRNQVGTTLQLQVDSFCEEICDAVKQWQAEVGGQADVGARINSMAKIQRLSGGFQMGADGKFSGVP